MTGHSSSHTAMGGGGEFDAIRAMLARWGPLADGIGDDAAVFTPPAGEHLVITTDACLEGVHFRAEWLTAEEIGGRAAAAACSDIAAMGARALAVLVALEVPSAWQDRLPALADGIGRVVAPTNARIIGGNITRGDRLGLTLTVIGAAAHPVRRHGARDGDGLWVTGRLGGPRRALHALERGDAPAPADRARFASPVPRLEEGRALAEAGARAMLDISDGLAADAGHLAAASGVVCELWIDAIPRLEGATLDDALAGGEEYELLVAMPPGFAVGDAAHRFGTPLTRIGTVRGTGSEPPGVVLRPTAEAIDGVRVDLPAGHDHLSR